MGYASTTEANAARERGTTLRVVRELSCGHYHEFEDRAPCEWSAERGATHTLFTIDGPRPAKLLKTVAYIGVDETPHGFIVWDKWQIR